MEILFAFFGGIIFSFFLGFLVAIKIICEEIKLRIDSGTWMPKRYFKNIEDIERVINKYYKWVS